MKACFEMSLAERRAALWAVVQQEYVLSKFLRENHPLFEFEPFALSESLSFNIRVRGLPWEVTGTGFCYDLGRVLADVTEETRFYAGLMSSIRALLFFKIHADTLEERFALPLLTQNGIDWQAVERFVYLSVGHLPLTVRFEQDENYFDIWLEMDGHASIRIRKHKASLASKYPFENTPQSRFVVTEALRDHLMIHLSRALLLDLMTESEALLRQNSGARTLELARQAGAALRAPVGAPVAQHPAAQGISSKLAQRIEMMSLKVPDGTPE